MPRVLPEDFENQPGHVLIYGGSGVGKTVLAGSALRDPTLCPIFYADFENGYISLKRFFGDLWDRMSLWTIHDMVEAGNIEKVAFAANSPFKTIVIDGVTMYHSLAMNTRLGGTTRAAGTPQQSDYYQISADILKLLWRIRRESKLNLIVTAGVQAVEDKATESLVISPDITGKLARRVPRIFDIVGYLTVDQRVTRAGKVTKEERYLQVQPYNRVRAKDRSGGLGALVVNPTAKRLFDALDHAPTPIFIGDDDEPEEEEVELEPETAEEMLNGNQDEPADE